MHHNARPIALLLLASLIAGCAEESPAPFAPAATKSPETNLDPPRQNVPARTSTSPSPLFVEADFALADVNPNSATYAQEVSPRACIGKISAWYFGYST